MKITAFIDLFRKGYRLRNPEGLKNAAAWSGFLIAVAGLIKTYGIELSWLTPELIDYYAGTAAAIFGSVVFGSHLVTSRKIGLPFLEPKSMPAPALVDSESWKALDPVKPAHEITPTIGDAGRYDRARLENSRQFISVPALQHGLTFAQVRREFGKTPGTYALRPAWIKVRGCLFRLDDDAKHNAGEYTYKFLHDGLPAVEVPWTPTNEDLRATDWLIIDSFTDDSSEYIFPAQPDVGCQVKIADYDGGLVMEKDYCITPDGVVQELTDQAKAKPKVVANKEGYNLKARRYIELLKKKNVQAFLKMIRYAEGTSDPEHYFVQYSYAPFTDYSDKPRKIIEANGYRSSAAGAYQIINRTWDDIQRALSLPDFSPLSQDVAALWLIERDNQLRNVINGDVDAAIKGVGDTWSSFPDNNYGQPKRSLASLKDQYEKARNLS